ncbi:protein ripply1-like [Polyodon spathula]|uniref:protein ripply1-like n=1 Tax=Polyodon spathula TaxID=7913 RepID=UPI001B7E0CEE|nr:protein ripply1-like [Polyodon spathula]
MESTAFFVNQTSFEFAPSYCLYSMALNGLAQKSSPPSLWRPWIMTTKDMERKNRRQQACPYARPANTGSFTETEKTQPQFQHPVRLFWPKSKSYDYLYSDGENLLKNFPVQATISFYEESDSEDEEEYDESESEQEVSPKHNALPATHFTSYN